MNYSDVPVFIVCRDRLSPLQLLVEWLEKAGQTNLILVDNASTWKPLVEYLKTSPHQIIRLTQNIGHLAVWQENLQQQFISKTIPGFYAVSDCDVVPDEQCPKDAIAYLYSILKEYNSIDKVGLGLKIDDLPDCFQFKNEVIDWESQFWEKIVQPGIYDASIDTTFALYRPNLPHSTLRALRTGSPYTAKHLPWYLDSAQLDAEEIYYRNHMTKTMTSWNRETLSPPLAAEIEVLRLRKSQRSGK